MWRMIFCVCAALWAVTGTPHSAEAFQRGAAGVPKYKIRLEIFSEGALQPAAAQTWGAELNKRDAGFQGVQIRGSGMQEELDAVNMGGNSWTVKGMLKRNDTVVMPGGRTFSVGQARGMYPYLEELIDAQVAQEEAAKVAAQTGMPVPTQRLPFGLNARAYEEMFTALEAPVGFQTKNMPRAAFITRVLKALGGRVEMDENFRRTLEAEAASPAKKTAGEDADEDENEDDLITEELSTLSRGTALAYALRYVGMCLVPGMESQLADAKLVYRLVPAKKNPPEIFPVGHDLQTPLVESFPFLLDRFEANVNGATVAAVLEAVEGRMKAPILYDYNNMARLGIETDQVRVKLKTQRMSYNELLDTVLYQAKLQKEVRVDEAGSVFVWVTVAKKMKNEK